MRLPKLSIIPSSREIISTFLGYNANAVIKDNQFSDMTNMSSDGYPTLKPRAKRGIYASHGAKERIFGIAAKDGVCYVAGEKLYIGEEEVSGLRLSVAEDKQIISMGAYIVILPDKKWYNTADKTYGSIEASMEAQGKVTMSMCKIDGDDVIGLSNGTDSIPAQDSAPDMPSDKDYWIDTSGETHVLMQYSETSGEWESVESPYIKIQFSEAIPSGFNKGDGIKIGGIMGAGAAPHHLNNTVAIIRMVGTNFVVIPGVIDAVYEQERVTGEYGSTHIYIERRMPKMDFVTESGNRLWGCRYGANADGVFVNEIYASKLGDFKNWNVYEGISTDSYAASCGTDGEFTGAITHLGYPLFFKERFVHKVYGEYPANFQIQSTAARGVQRGCHKSLAIVNETLFYKSQGAVCAFDGSLPSEVSDDLGEEIYSSVTGGALGNKYYMSARDMDGVYHLFVYDTRRRTWHREDNTRADGFCTYGGDLYYINHDTNQVMNVRGTTGLLDTNEIVWEAVTGLIGTDTPDRKYIASINVRMLLEIGTEVDVYAEYDSVGEWVLLYHASGDKMRAVHIPIRPHRCDHMRLKICGIGEAKLFSITKTTEDGSDAE